MKSSYVNIGIILGQTGVLEVKPSRPGKSLKFPIYLTEKLENTDLDALELSVRASNSLKRAGYRTIGDLVNNISHSSDLKRIRNCGETSVAEIMDKLFAYQYISLPKGRRMEFIAKVAQMNEVDYKEVISG